MRIACVGKGGSGKTTLASLLMKALQGQKAPVLAIDADINQHLAFAMGLPPEATDIPALGDHVPDLKTILWGQNSLIPSPAAMIKTTLPGPGSHIVALDVSDPVLRRFGYCEDRLVFLRTGGFQSYDIGIRCFHAKTGATELILNHLYDAPHDWTIVDMTAGADVFASGLFTRFDMTLVAVEPTVQSVSVFEQYKSYAADYGVAVRAVGNKIHNTDDVEFLCARCGDDLIASIPQSDWVKSQAKGLKPDIAAIEPDVRAALKNILDVAMTCQRDWNSYWHWGVHFHRKNALNWGNQAVGQSIEDLYDIAFLKSFNDGLTPIEKQAAGQHVA